MSTTGGRRHAARERDLAERRQAKRARRELRRRQRRQDTATRRQP
jgi:hypothetical protein